MQVRIYKMSYFNIHNYTLTSFLIVITDSEIVGSGQQDSRREQHPGHAHHEFIQPWRRFPAIFHVHDGFSRQFGFQRLVEGLYHENGRRPFHVHKVSLFVNNKNLPDKRKTYFVGLNYIHKRSFLNCVIQTLKKVLM